MKVTVGQTRVRDVRIRVNIRPRRSKHAPNDGTGGYGGVNVSSEV